MAAGKYNILLQQGADYIQKVTLKDSATQAVVDLTGCTIRGQIRITYSDASPVASFTTSDEDLPNGTFTLRLSSAVTTALDFETGVYDIEVVYPNTIVDRVLQGKVVLSREATR